MARYHLTIKNHADGLPPCQAFTVGKLDFRLVTQIPSKMEGVPDEVYRGAVGEYSEDDVAAFRELVKNFVVRWGFRKTKDGEVVHSAQVHDVRCRDAIRVPGREEPLSLYLGVQKIGAANPISAVSEITAEEAAAKQDAEANEARARASDSADTTRRRVHARAKAGGESLTD